jgi:hypothetical protein
MAVAESHAVTRRGAALRRGAAVAAVALLAGVVAGCGGSSELVSAGLPGDGPARTPTGPAPSEAPDPTASPGPVLPSGARTGSAADLLRDARAAFAGAPSVRVTGTAVRGSDAYVVDLRLKGAAGGRATIRTSGQTVDVVRVGDTAYVGGDLAFWRGVTGDDAAAAKNVGRYVEVPARDGNFSQFTAFTWPDVVTAVLPDPAAPATVGAPTQIGGRVALAVRDGAGSTLSIAATGPAYPLRLDGLASGQVVFLDFSEYGAPVELRAPQPGQVVDGGPGQGS